MSAFLSYERLNLIRLPTVALSSNIAPVSGFGLDKLRTRQLPDCCRFNTTGTGVQITVDLGAATAIRVAAVLGSPTSMNLTGGNLYNYSMPVHFTLSSSTNGIAWTVRGQSISQDAMVPPISAGNGMLALSGGITARWWRFQLNHGPPAGRQVEVGHLWLGNAIELPQGLDGDWTMAVEDTGDVVESESLAAYPTYSGTIRRLLKSKVSKLDVMQALGYSGVSGFPANVPSFQAMQSVGRTGSVLVIPRHDATPVGMTYARRLGLFGRLARELELRRLSGDYFEVPALDVVEELL